MSIKITKECINCGACEIECPNQAIYEGGKAWKMSDGTSLKKNGKDFTIFQKPIKQNIYFIVSEKCTECVGFFDKPQCIEVCPVNCCILDKKNEETKKYLKKKYFFLHKKKIYD
ncbi:4Fe-4S dicluster domain-containing protein [Blattabacterium cuenoti]|uniref:4Fe-4S dicluster domain-containing protein n=1 Tax=Blattabacterium cuenoti TaxID=1653831 RepID=UPI00163CB97D|nr:4Fe-4S dicluster domain-containing protein [Blattabacterium cuenoti]